MRENLVKEKLRAGQTVFGTMVFEFFSPGIAQICKSAGAEFVLYDLEHSAASLETLKQQFAACRGLHIAPFVRVPADEYHFIARALDAGAMGIMVPMVETPEQAKAIVAATRYPPHGRRGTAFGMAHDDYEIGPVTQKVVAANARTLVICLIETPIGIENAAEIAQVDGVDVCWLGHFDLTSFMGIPGEFDHPRFVEAVGQLTAACKSAGCVMGFMAGDEKWGRDYLDKGFRLIAYGLDISLLQSALASGIDRLRRHTEAKASRRGAHTSGRGRAA